MESTQTISNNLLCLFFQQLLNSWGVNFRNVTFRALKLKIQVQSSLVLFLHMPFFLFELLDFESLDKKKSQKKESLLQSKAAIISNPCLKFPLQFFIFKLSISDFQSFCNF